MADDDFEKADAQAGVTPGAKVEVMAPERKNTAITGRTSDIMVYRQQLIEQYHDGAANIFQRLKEAGQDDRNAVVLALIDELIRETDHLLGNELVATQNGELRDASVISVKRSEVLEKAIIRLQLKQEADKSRGMDIDVDSSEMKAVFRFFLAKVKECFEKMNMGNEVSDLFYKTFADATEDWKREIREYLEETSRSGAPR